MSVVSELIQKAVKRAQGKAVDKATDLSNEMYDREKEKGAGGGSENTASQGLSPADGATAAFSGTGSLQGEGMPDLGTGEAGGSLSGEADASLEKLEELKRNGGENGNSIYEVEDIQEAEPAEEDWRSAMQTRHEAEMQELKDYYDGRRNFYNQLFERLQKPEDEETRRKRERRERAKRIIAGVSDGIAALSNVYFTSKGAPNMYEASGGSALSKVDQRLREAAADRAKADNNYYNIALKLDELERKAQDAIRGLGKDQQKELQGEQKLRDQMAKQEFNDAKHELELKLLQGKIDGQTYENELKKLKADYAREHGTTMPTTPKPSTGGRSGGGSGSGNNQWGIKNKKTGEIKYISAKSKAQAVSMVPDGWELIGGTTVTTKRDSYGDTETRTTGHQTGQPGMGGFSIHKKY